MPSDTLPNPRAVDRDPPVGLILDVETHNRIISHLSHALPNEGCGLLATARGAAPSPVGDAERAMHFYPGSNIDASPTRYTMDPVEVLAAFRDMEAHGWRLGAIVHAHPLTPPSPSPTDLREAHYPGALMLIVSFVNSKSAPEMRAWRVDAGAGPATVMEVSVVVREANLP